MSLFVYEAFDADGKLKKGELEADSEQAARKLVKAMQLVPRHIAAAERVPAAASATAGFSRAFSQAELQDFLQQFATLLNAGIPLAEALASIAEGMEQRRMQRIVTRLRQQVMEGRPLALSMRELGFDEIACNMVAAAEESGQLASVVSRLAELVERRQQMLQALLSATLYPLVVTGFSMLVMVFLLAYVVPQVVGVFSHAGGKLPWMTLALLGISEWIRNDGLWAILLIALLATGYRYALRRPPLRAARDRALLQLPWVGGLLCRIEIARFTRTLGVLLAGGVPILQALHIAAHGVGLLPVRQMLLDAGEALREGRPLAATLAQSRYVPRLAIRLIAVGEQGGALDAMLIRIADSFEEQGTHVLKRMVTLAEPLLVMLMAAMVGSMALAILLPIMDMNELVR